MITKPTLLLDELKCKANIANMFARAKKHDLIFRPHFKTHQSLEIGRWFKEVGVSKITVSSLEMAEYFSEEWNNITVAFPINTLEIETVNRLSKKIQINVLIESEETAVFLIDNLKEHINYFIKINVGNNRTGLLPNETESIDSILKASKKTNLLSFEGFLGHAGQTYNCRGTSEVLKVHSIAKGLLINLKQLYIKDYPELIISYGDTPSCSLADNFLGIDEIRPGNFIFYDLMQLNIGSCIEKDIAVSLVCPIVSIHEDRNEMVVYGGGIHLSKDNLEDDKHGKIYGAVAQPNKIGWGNIIPNMVVRSLSQEHGVIKMPKSNLKDYKVGDLLYILPVHSCMTANLMKNYLSTNRRSISMLKS